MIHEDGTLVPPLLEAVRGGRRPEHPRAREAIVSPYSVLEGYRWVADASLGLGERAVLLFLFRHVDSQTWRWPPRGGDRGGSSLADIATGIGRTVRHTRRLLRALERRGVIATVDRRPARNEYQIFPEVLRELGLAGLAAQRAARAARRAADVIAEIAADEALSVGAASATTEALEALGEPGRLVEVGAMVQVGDRDLPEGQLPAWASTSGPRHGVRPELAAGLVRALHAAAGGAGSWLKEGQLCRGVCRLWRHLGEPSLAEWEALLARVVEARGSGRLVRVLPKKLPAGAAGLFVLVNSRAVRAAAEVQPAPVPVPAESPSDCLAEEPVEINLPAPIGPRPGDLRAWQRALAEIRGEIGGPFFDVWIRPLELVGFDGERVLVRCPGALFATWVAENYAAHLTRAADGPVRLFFRS